MEFGKLTDIQGVDWTLPPDDPRNGQRLLSPSYNSRIFMGSPAWGCRNWLGKIYPPRTPPERFLYYYSRYFNCIELNSTHYRLPTPKMVEEWLSQVPPHFHFCPKLHKDISHSKIGLTDKGLMRSWSNFLSLLGENLGPCFIQFHEFFSYESKMLLFRFLENWPREFKLSIELRHPSWFLQNTILPALGDYLCKRKIGLVMTDVAGRRDVLHTSLTVPWTMIRLIGNDLEESDKLRLQSWAKRLKVWQQKGIEQTYLFLHQPEDRWTIEFSQMAGAIFGEANFCHLPPFEIERPRGLFDSL